MNRRLSLLVLGGALLLAGCAQWPRAEPLRVNLVGLQPLTGEGLEWRFAVRLRVQNPGDQAIDYDGVSLALDLRDAPFASGVAPIRGQVPRFGEVLLTIPVTVSGFALARQMLGLARDSERGEAIGRVRYALRGTLGGSVLGSVRFESVGEIDLDPGAR